MSSKTLRLAALALADAGLVGTASACASTATYSKDTA